MTSLASLLYLPGQRKPFSPHSSSFRLYLTVALASLRWRVDILRSLIYVTLSIADTTSLVSLGIELFNIIASANFQSTGVAQTITKWWLFISLRSNWPPHDFPMARAATGCPILEVRVLEFCHSIKVWGLCRLEISPDGGIHGHVVTSEIQEQLPTHVWLSEGPAWAALTFDRTAYLLSSASFPQTLSTS